MVASGNFWNLEIENREIWKLPEIGYFWPISIYWVCFPLSLGHWPWFSTQNFKFPIFLESGNWTSGNLEIPGNWLFWANFNILSIFPTQFRLQNLILNSEFQIFHFSGFFSEIFWKSGNSRKLTSLGQFQYIGYFSHSV